MKEAVRQFIIANKELFGDISEEELEEIRKLMVSRVTARTLTYFCKHTEGTAKEVMKETGLSDRSIYWALKRLRRMGIIRKHRILPSSRYSLGGRRETIWRIE